MFVVRWLSQAQTVYQHEQGVGRQELTPLNTMD